MIRTPDFSKNPDGLLPVIVQDVVTKNVLMQAYMNKEAHQKTIDQKRVWFYSRSKNRLWLKGEQSENYLNLVAISYDCDQDSILVKVNPEGPTCHLGTDTCWAEPNALSSLDFIKTLENVIEQRISDEQKDSYVSSLVQKGINKVAQKVGEEAVELVIESMDNNEQTFLEESADLLFHYIVLLKAKGYSINDSLAVLEKRHKNR
jgi:phosphoribosyl-ATP pyrophosphohydrolase/phosphoribosyl-AMP cyclohydrolase